MTTVTTLDELREFGEDRSRCDTCGCRSLSVCGVQMVYGVRRCAACYDLLSAAPASVPTPAPLDRAEVVRVLVAEATQLRVTGLGVRADTLRLLEVNGALARIAIVLGLIAEFEAACKEVRP